MRAEETLGEGEGREGDREGDNLSSSGYLELSVVVLGAVIICCQPEDEANP